MSRGKMSLAILILITAGLVAAASPAMAERAYETSFGGFTDAYGVAIDDQDQVWVSDTGAGGLIPKLDADGNLLGQESGDGHFGYGGLYIRSLAVDALNDHLFVADSGPVALLHYDSAGNFVESIGGFPGATTMSPSTTRAALPPAAST